MIRMRAMLSGARGVLLVVVLSLLAACSALSPDGSIRVTQTGDNPAPLAVPNGTDPDDSVIGLREHPRIIANYGGVYTDRQAEIMLARIVGRLLGAANQPNTNFTVTILDSAEVNAFALPGGYIYVTRGILALANDTSELAAVLAHEIAHVVLRHARARSNRTRTTAIVDKVITGVFGSDAGTDPGSNQAKVALAAFSQNQELEADREGILISGKAGFDPLAASRFLGVMGRFARFSAGESAEGDDFLSSHPSTPDRIQKAVEIATTNFATNVAINSDPDGYLAAIAGVAFGDSPQQGAIVGRRFVHPTLKFTFTVPAGYTLQSSQSAVVGVAGDGEAVRFDSAEVPTNIGLADYLRSGWIAGLLPETVTTGSANGLETATGVAKTDQWLFRVAVVRFNGSVYRFIFAAKGDSSRFAAGADETLVSFRPATTADLSQVRKVAVKIVTARAGDTADTLAQQMQGLTRGRDLFYVLNDLYPGDPVVPGQGYKVVTVQ